MPDNTIEKLDIQITSSAAGASKALDALASRLGKLNEITKQLGDMSTAGINKLSKLADAVNKLGSTDASKLSRTINALGKLNKAGSGAINSTEPMSPGGEEVDVTPDTSKNASKLVSVLTYLRQRLADVRVGASEASKAMNNGFSGRLGRRIRSLFEYRIIKAFFNAITSGVREGINNVYQWSKSFNGIFSKSMDKISTAGLYLKNSIGAALTSLINMAAPILDKLVDMVVSVINVINQLIAMITGASVWTKAKKYPKEYANAVSGAAKQISKSLAPFDEINNIGNSSGGGGGSSGMDYSQMFEEKALSGNWKIISDLIKANITEIEQFLSGALLVLGAVLTFSGANIPLGLGLMAAGAYLFAKSVVPKWNELDATIGDKILIIERLVAGGLTAVGAILAFSGTNIPLGIGLMAAGLSMMAATMDWSTLPAELADKLSYVAGLVGLSLLAVGAVLAFSGINIPLGIALMVAGLGSAYTGMKINWDALNNEVGGALGSLGDHIRQRFSAMKQDIHNVWDSVKSKTREVWNNLGTTVKNTAENIRSWVYSKFTTLGTNVYNAFLSMKTRALSVFGSLKQALVDKWNALKNWWSNLSLGSFGIKLPHFSISTNSWGLPKISVDWYAKGGLFSGPQIIGVGEYAGADSNPEVVAPLETLKGMLGSSNDETNDILEKILEVLETKNYSPVLNVQEVGKAIAKYNKDQGRILGVRPI